MANYEIVGLNEAGPDLRAPTAADTGLITNLSVAQALTAVAVTASGKVLDINGLSLDSGSNYLDIFEDSTAFIPELQTDGTPFTSISYGVQVGRTARIGPFVLAQGRIIVSSVSGGSGNVYLTLPTTPDSTANAFACGIIQNAANFASVTPIGASVLPGNLNALLQGQSNSDAQSATNNNIQVSNLNASCIFDFTFIYLAE